MTTRETAQPKAVDATDDFQELSDQNIKALTSAIQTSAETVDMLISKITSLACHITALEALLSEVITITGVDLVQVNATIRSRITAVDGHCTDANTVVDIAAAIACPLTSKPR